MDRTALPQDEKFHLYKLGRGVVYSGLYFAYDNAWENRYYAKPMTVAGVVLIGSAAGGDRRNERR